MKSSLAFLLLVSPLSAQTPAPNGVAALTGPAAPVMGGVITIKGTITGNAAGYQIPTDYATAELGIYQGGGQAFSVSVRWDQPLPAVLNSGDVLSFSAQIPANRVLGRCVPTAASAVCAFDAQGPFAAGRTRDFNVDLDMTRVEFEVEESASEQTRWSAARVADKGKYKGKGKPDYEPGTLLVGFAPGVPLEQAEKRIVGSGMKLVRAAEYSSGVSATVIFPPQMTIEDAENLLSGHVRYTEPNFIIRLFR